MAALPSSARSGAIAANVESPPRIRPPGDKARNNRAMTGPPRALLCGVNIVGGRGGAAVAPDAPRIETRPSAVFPGRES